MTSNFILYLVGCFIAFPILRIAGNHFDEDSRTEGYIYFDFYFSFLSWGAVMLVGMIYFAGRAVEGLTGIKYKKNDNTRN